MQICIRGVLRACALPCPTQLNDMCLSVWGQREYHVPLDVAAQFMPGRRDGYVDLFTGSLLREIRAARQTAMNPPTRVDSRVSDSSMATLTLNVDIL